MGRILPTRSTEISRLLMISDRRNFLTTVASGATSMAAASVLVAVEPALESTEGSPMSSGIRYCLNTSTVRGQELNIEQQVDLVGKAGYSGIEPWMGDLVKYRDAGGSLSDLRKRISDNGLTVESAIGFANWIVDDEADRKKGLEDAKHDMDLLREIGGLRIAAPPVGAQNGPVLDLFDIIDRYKALLAVGDAADVVPQLEVWGFSTNLHRLGHSVAVCVESNHPKACLLPDVYHLYRGGSDFQGLDLLSDDAIQVFHMNDYPHSPARNELNDSDRVYPGDGVAPFNSILQSIAGGGRSVALSLELFNRDYWEQDAMDVATTGLRKMQDAVAVASLS
jgi:sugar phosphate isomerase/epimerase